MRGRAFQKSGGRALVAEDNESNFELVRDLLQSCGWSVARAYDGGDVLDALRVDRFDLVLLDLHMPRIDGMGALRQLKVEPVANPPRIVVITADVFFGVGEDLASLGVDGVLGKPIDLEALAEVLATTAAAAAVVA
jgi:two-component system, sensor histidine kinase